jgi:L-lactate dehydrogenase complex protein LldG
MSAPNVPLSNPAVREEIFGRIREALRVPSHLPHGHAPGTPPLRAAEQAHHCLPPAGATAAQWLEQFRANAAELRAVFHVCQDESAAAGVLREISSARGWKRVACHGQGSAARLAGGLGLDVVRTDAGCAAEELESCDAGITECDALVAQTGSVLVTSSSAGGRALSVLPPHHIVVGRSDQLLPDLPAAYELLHQRYGARMPSMISLITGPSRTGDIERILVLGAHGPKELTILLVQAGG